MAFSLKGNDHANLTERGILPVPVQMRFPNQQVAQLISWDANKVPVLAPDHVEPSPGESRLIQAKLIIGRTDDPLEHEADRVADQVMRMPDPALPDDFGLALAPPLVRGNFDPMAGAANSRVQRDKDEDEIQEQLVQAYLSDTEILQRQVDEPDEEESSTAGEQILLQSKPAGKAAQLTPDLETATRSLEGGGDPLPSTVRAFMEPRFGHDFSNVRVHADSRAAEMAALANARAFTMGRNVVFSSGEYAPNGTASRQLLAHELAHVIQQGRAGPRLQRKIVVGGKPYVPSAKYLTYLDGTFGPAMKEFVEHMHNGGSPPIYSFSSYEQLGYEVRTRANAIKGIEDVHKGCCDYYSSAHPPHLDSTYWDQVGGGVNFKLKSPLPVGKQPSDAIEAIFKPGAGTRLECLSMTLAIEYFAMLKGLGEAKFNAKFPAGAGIAISAAPTALLFTGADKKYEIKSVASKSEILPGDWVYFKNFHDYTTRVPGGFWQGENAICLGSSKFRGFGVAVLSETAMNQELVDKYNTEALPHLSKTVADLLADGGGLLLSPVVRPIIAKIAP